MQMRTTPNSETVWVLLLWLSSCVCVWIYCILYCLGHLLLMSISMHYEYLKSTLKPWEITTQHFCTGIRSNSFPSDLMACVISPSQTLTCVSVYSFPENTGIMFSGLCWCRLQMQSRKLSQTKICVLKCIHALSEKQILVSASHVKRSLLKIKYA